MRPEQPSSPRWDTADRHHRGPPVPLSHYALPWQTGGVTSPLAPTPTGRLCARPGISLVLCDLDGTLLDPESMVSSRTLSAIDALRRRGVHFGTASGRDLRSLEALFDLWGLTGLVDVAVGMNGADVADLRTGRVERDYLVRPEVFRDIMAVYADLPVNFAVVVDGTYVAAHDDGLLDALAESGRVRTAVDPGLVATLDQPRTKLHVMCHAGDMARVERRAQLTDATRATGVRTADTLFEFQYPGINKAVGMRRAAAMLGLEAGRVMAFGDAENDVEMLHEAAVGVAMGNARPAVRQVADHGTATNADDGVAVFLMDWFGLD